MITRIEISGFKTFDDFILDLMPFSAIVGPNASGKSNLFDAIRFLSRLAQDDIRTAMRDLRGEPEELFRQTESGPARDMRFAVEVLLSADGIDAFGTAYQIKSRRLRYGFTLSQIGGPGVQTEGVFITDEYCKPIARKDERAGFLEAFRVSYGDRRSDFITTKAEHGKAGAFEIRQDGPNRHGNPLRLSATRASRTALSTISTAEYPHLCALRELLASIRFLEINPRAARRPSDRFESKTLHPDASNLAAVLARLKDETGTPMRPAGVIADISADLATLIPSVQRVDVLNDPHDKEYAFSIATSERLHFSSRVISDGTLRLLALLALLDDPARKGVLCFEEPENGVHEGRIPALVSFLREAVSRSDSAASDAGFQILVNTHSPALLEQLNDTEVVFAELVTLIDPAAGRRTSRTRMTNVIASDQFPLDERDLTRARIALRLRQGSDAA